MSVSTRSTVCGTGLVQGPGSPSEHLVSAAVRDAAEFFNVYVHQVFGMLVFVADGFGAADWQRSVSVRDALAGVSRVSVGRTSVAPHIEPETFAYLGDATPQPP